MTHANNESYRYRITDRIVIYQRGQRRIWCADFHLGNHHGRRSLKTRNRRIAEERAWDLEAKLAGGKVAPLSSDSVMIDGAVEQFLNSKRTDGCAKKTLAKYLELQKFAAFLREKHGVFRVNRINLAMVDQYKVHRLDVDKLDPYTVYTILIILKTWTNWCRKRGLISTNPLQDLGVKKPRRRRHPAATLSQINTILGKSVGWLFPVLATAAFAGLRIGEIEALRPENIDFDKRVIHIQRREDWTPKTAGSERDVPIPRRLFVILRALNPTSRKWFFTAPPSRQFPTGNHHIDARDVNEDFKRLAMESGFPTGRDTQGLTLHSLRRFYKTFSLDAGVPKPMVDGWMGHQDQNSMDHFYYDSSKSLEWIDRVPFGEPSEQEVAQLKLTPKRKKPGRPKREIPKNSPEETSGHDS